MLTLDKTLSRADKLKLMEMLWDDLSANAKELAPPDWHGAALDTAAQAHAAGQAVFVDWPQAKRQLRGG
ncbi:MAG: addiction module protein [Burkholderiaceae bacterium]|nr:addiction module protein [Burkholderiaceae bacterium]